MVKRVKLPAPEDLSVEEPAFDSDPVELRVTHELVFLVLEVHDAPVEDSRARKRDVVELIDPGLVKGLPAEDRVEAEVVLHDHVEHVLVEVVAHEEGDLAIGLTSVDE